MLLSETTTFCPPVQSAVDSALAAAVEYSWRTQREDGSWQGLCDIGPLSTAQMVVTLHFLGRLTREVARDASRWLVSQQLPDGSFEGHPYARRGDRNTTATALAALHVAGCPADSYPVRVARQWLDQNGGIDGVLRAIGRGEPAAYNLVIAGLLDPARLPRLPLSFCLIEPLMEAMERRFNGAIVTIGLEHAILSRRLRGEWGPDGQSKPPQDEAACRRILRLLDEFQNADGSWWNAVTPWSGMILSTIHAMALPESESRIARGLPPLDALRVSEVEGLRWAAFRPGVWETSFQVKALLAAGESADDSRIRGAAEWLCQAQIQGEQSQVNNKQQGVARAGGWSFQLENEALPDTDDTAVAIAALAKVAEQSTDVNWKAELRSKIDAGLRWLSGMKNPDGGWATYAQGLPSRPPGPFMMTLPAVDWSDPFTAAQTFFEPPPELGDPSYDDVAGRVLHALGEADVRTDHPDVLAAIEFLKHHQLPDGHWWGRWLGYTVTTAWILIGLRSVGVDPAEEWFQKAVRWLLLKQNRDGGWGEPHQSYANPELAGMAASMPAVTGIVLVALCDAGLQQHAAVTRGAAYLVESQRPDGTWEQNDFLHTLIAPDTHYSLAPAAHYWPLEGLARATIERAEPEPVELPERHRDSFLDAMRHECDPRADAAFAELVALNPAPDFAALFAPRSGTLPPPLAAYLTDTAALPDWADAPQIELAQNLFTRHGWEVALSLFYVALPQGYAAGPCARSLCQTGNMLERARHRIFETAQFLFDVLEPSGLAPGGRGIVACQRVRLLHSAIRHRSSGAAGLDGRPVNQEDMQGTVLLFGMTTLHTFDKLGLTITRDERAAWLHTWAVVGHLLGVDRRLLPRSLAEAEVQLLAFRRRHWQATPEGRQLTASLVELMQSYYPAPFAQVPIALIRYFSGAHCADLLGLPKVDWSRLAVETGIWLSTQWGQGKVMNQLGDVAQRVVQQAMQGLMLLQVQGQNVNWGELAANAMQLTGVTTPSSETATSRTAVVRNLAYWAMRSIVAVERGHGTRPLRLPPELA